jgi:hypothetical protein
MMAESGPSRLDRERTLVRLLVRQNAGASTPEEEVPWQKLQQADK